MAYAIASEPNNLWGWRGPVWHRVTSAQWNRVERGRAVWRRRQDDRVLYRRDALAHKVVHSH